MPDTYPKPDSSDLPEWANSDDLGNDDRGSPYENNGDGGEDRKTLGWKSGDKFLPKNWMNWIQYQNGKFLKYLFSNIAEGFLKQHFDMNIANIEGFHKLISWPYDQFETGSDEYVELLNVKKSSGADENKTWRFYFSSVNKEIILTQNCYWVQDSGNWAADDTTSSAHALSWKNTSPAGFFHLKKSTTTSNWEWNYIGGDEEFSLDLSGNITGTSLTVSNNADIGGDLDISGSFTPSTIVSSGLIRSGGNLEFEESEIERVDSNGDPSPQTFTKTYFGTDYKSIYGSLEYDYWNVTPSNTTDLSIPNTSATLSDSEFAALLASDVKLYSYGNTGAFFNTSLNHGFYTIDSSGAGAAGYADIVLADSLDNALQSIFALPEAIRMAGSSTNTARLKIDIPALAAVSNISINLFTGLTGGTNTVRASYFQQTGASLNTKPNIFTLGSLQSSDSGTSGWETLTFSPSITLQRENSVLYLEIHSPAAADVVWIGSTVVTYTKYQFS